MNVSRPHGIVLVCAPVGPVIRLDYGSLIPWDAGATMSVAADERGRFAISYERVVLDV